LNTKKIIQIRDLFWFEKCYNDWRKSKAPLNSQGNHDNNGESIESKRSSEFNPHLKGLENSSNPDATRIVKDTE
jgi:hypothetical protein